MFTLIAMQTFALLFARVNDLWFAAPLIVSISLVYAGTRHEDKGDILRHAFRVAVWIAGFMAVILAVLFVVSLLA